MWIVKSERKGKPVCAIQVMILYCLSGVAAKAIGKGRRFM